MAAGVVSPATSLADAWESRPATEHRIPGLLLRIFQAEFSAYDAEGKELWRKKLSISGRKPIPVRGILRIEAPAEAEKYQVEIRHWLQLPFEGEGLPELNPEGFLDKGIIFAREFPKKA